MTISSSSAADDSAGSPQDRTEAAAPWAPARHGAHGSHPAVQGAVPDIHHPAPQPASLWQDAMGRGASRAAQILLLGALAAGLVYVLIIVQVAVIAALVALILATTVGPLVNRLVRRGMPRWGASAIVFLGLVALVSGVIAAVAATAVAEWDELSAQIGQGLGDLESLLTDPAIPVDSQILGDLAAQASSMLTSSSLISSLFTGFGTVGSVVAGLLLMLVMLFFFLKDGPRMWNFALRWFHGPIRARMAETGDRTAEVLGGYVRGIVIVAVVDATLIGLGLWLLGVPMALPLAVLCFLSAFIPIVGPLISGLFAALVALVTLGLPTALAVAALTILVNNLDGNILQPLIVGKSLSLHPLVVLTALTIGGLVGGIVGTVLATPLTAVAWSVIQIWSDRYQTGDDPVLGQDPVDPATSAARRASLAERWRYQAMRLQPVLLSSRGATAADAGAVIPAPHPPADPQQDPVGAWPVFQPDGGTPEASPVAASLGDAGAPSTQPADPAAAGHDDDEPAAAADPASRAETGTPETGPEAPGSRAG